MIQSRMLIAMIALASAARGADIVINFDELAVPQYFSGATRLTDAYAEAGVAFSGPGGNDGLGVLQARTFVVDGYSGTNVLCGNTGANFADGGVPHGPETISLVAPIGGVPTPAGYFEILAGTTADGGGIGEPLILDAYNGATKIGSASIDLTQTLQPISITAAGITGVVLTTDAPVPVFDDLKFLAKAPYVGRGFGDFDGSNYVDITDFLFMLDYWNLVSPLGGAEIGLPDFLALLDHWNTYPTDPV